MTRPAHAGRGDRAGFAVRTHRTRAWRGQRPPVRTFLAAVMLACALAAPTSAAAADHSRSGAGLVVSATLADPAPPNPWGYTFDGGSLIFSPPSNFCDYFNCIASFWNGTGYVVQCVDGTFSLSGGRSGVCSSHAVKTSRRFGWSAEVRRSARRSDGAVGRSVDWDGLERGVRSLRSQPRHFPQRQPRPRKPRPWRSWPQPQVAQAALPVRTSSRVGESGGGSAGQDPVVSGGRGDFSAGATPPSRRTGSSGSSVTAIDSGVRRRDPPRPIGGLVAQAGSPRRFFSSAFSCLPGDQQNREPAGGEVQTGQRRDLVSERQESQTRKNRRKHNRNGDQDREAQYDQRQSEASLRLARCPASVLHISLLPQERLDRQQPLGRGRSRLTQRTSDHDGKCEESDRNGHGGAARRAR